MKLSKSKLSLAKAINENGGWPERALWAVQDNCIAFFRGGKPEYKSGDRCWYSNCLDGACVGTITRDEKVTNWHQTILRREEYYHAYPKSDADGWIEWGGGECPVEKGLMVDIRVRDGREELNLAANTHTKGRTPDASCAFWKNDGMAGDIIAYRLHKAEVKPGFCESVMRSIPEPEAKPSIEQLAADYRNAKNYADRKQQEADDAKAASDAALGELERAGEALGLLIGIAKPATEPELVITDWRDLKVGDEIELLGDGWNCDNAGKIGVVRRIEDDGYNDDLVILCDIGEEGSDWGLGFKFIRRP